MNVKMFNLITGLRKDALLFMRLRDTNSELFTHKINCGVKTRICLQCCFSKLLFDYVLSLKLIKVTLSDRGYISERSVHRLDDKKKNPLSLGLSLPAIDDEVRKRWQKGLN